MNNIEAEETSPFELVEFAERLIERAAAADVTSAEEYLRRSGLLDQSLDDFLRACATEIIAKKLKIDRSKVTLTMEAKYAEYRGRAERAQARVDTLRQNAAAH